MIKAKDTVLTLGEDGDGDLMGLMNHVGLTEKDAFFRTMEESRCFTINCDSVCAVRVSVKTYACALR